MRQRVTFPRMSGSPAFWVASEEVVEIPALSGM